MTAAMPVLAVDNLRVSYGSVDALHGVSLEVYAGETVALIGSNGAGKSTTLRAISGLLKARAGAIVWQGLPIHNLSPDRIVAAGVAHCPEERHVWPHMTVEENIRLGAYLCRSREEIRRRVAVAFDRFPRLRERSGQLAGTLSGGEQQMLAIARALMSEPTLLMLDEPSLGLSPKMATEVFEIVREINALGVTVLLVEQNIHNALAIAGRAYVIETGRVTASRSSSDLRGDPELVRAYLGGAPAAA
jgi:ABC-type branched-subunit amino acid transport system ATPase component